MLTAPRPRHRARPVGVVAAGAALVLGACTGDGGDVVAPTTSVPATTTTVAERENDGRLVIGAYLPQTGPGAALGEPMIAAFRAAIDHINANGGVLGKDVGFHVLDEGSATGPAPLLAQGVDAIVGPASSRTAIGQLASIVQTAAPVVACSPTATALSLDDYPDVGYFFRTVPSDSLQMAAIARRAERTGVTSIAVGYLDDPYGRGLARALRDEVDRRGRQDVVAQVGFDPDQEDLTGVVRQLLADEPGLIVVLGDADAGGRLLTALDEATPDDTAQVYVNDTIRNSGSIKQLSASFRSRLRGVAPQSTSDVVDGFFAAHAVDRVNLIALAAIEAESDAPSDIRLWMAPVSGGGRQCTSFEDCVALQQQGLQIDYNGLSGAIELSSTTGDPTRATFVEFGFDAEGDETEPATTFEVS